MRSREGIRALLATALTLATAVVFVMAGNGAVCAEEDGCTCYYGGSYSHGACIQSICPPNLNQQCLNGMWLGCESGCPSREPCVEGG